MLSRCFVVYRKAVAQFSARDFRPRQSIALTPENVTLMLKSKLHPNDRLLRQSTVGPGASRFLIVDRNQCVRGIYRPLLCLPYPMAGSSVLGVPVESYLQVVEQKLLSEENTTLIFVSHANGFSFTVYGIDGSLRLPLVHLKLPGERSVTAGKMSDRDMRPFVNTTNLMDDLAELVTDHYTTSIHPCSSFFYLSGSDSVLSFSETKAAWRERGYADKLPLSFEDKRWVSLPDLAAQHRGVTPLYCTDFDGYKVVDERGLTTRVKLGRLELDS
ncbi:hypothetical protein, conserved [Trypanosoma brucei gambiense DAL972]|uniref:Uncharacterized protein n=2 Tax=Trypanosoma brucei TaxID=5691 RepID=D0A2U4_TRYB9|nr:hypothetical protein, conserved [Trypanosoma brucei gambiense DAL972]RHW68842.1 hypothetical protein DPX39_100060700 [Trypanosoma brucei equiperdum]CBH15588.1 hypothetical protein, conserved [Trypanosoma brucei gambiense DAL972]|eukprot:XP_011777852.1 hypothetical protein, conserved [Trypanosoma brucei gambiense DAL972]